MKRRHLLLLPFIIGAVIEPSFAQQTGKNALLPDKQLVYCRVNLQNDSMARFIHNYFPDTSLIKQLTQSTTQGNLNAYEPQKWPFEDLYQYDQQLKKLDDFAIKQSMGYRVDTVRYKKVDGSLGHQVVRDSIRYEQMNTLHFVESWHFNPKAFTFQKQVLAIDPIRQYVSPYNGNTRHQYTFRLLYPSASGKNHQEKTQSQAKAYKKIRYEVTLQKKRNAPFFNHISRKRLFKAIFQKIKSGHITARDFHDSTPLSWQQVLKRMDADNDTLQQRIRQPDGTVKVKELARQRHIRYQEIKSFYFIEKWLFNPQSLRIQKDVLGIAPVRHINPNQLRKWKAKTEEGMHQYGFQLPKMAPGKNGKTIKIIPFMVYFN